MTKATDRWFDDYVPEADVAEQRVPVEPDEDNWLDAGVIGAARERDANEADLVEQAISVPLPDDR
jgi:hypothetical protein